MLTPFLVFNYLKVQKCGLLCVFRHTNTEQNNTQLSISLFFFPLFLSYFFILFHSFSCILIGPSIFIFWLPNMFVSKKFYKIDFTFLSFGKTSLSVFQFTVSVHLSLVATICTGHPQT